MSTTHTPFTSNHTPSTSLYSFDNLDLESFSLPPATIPLSRCLIHSHLICRTTGLITFLLLPLFFFLLLYFDITWQFYILTIPAAMQCEWLVIAAFDPNDEKCKESWMVRWHPAVYFMGDRGSGGKGMVKVKAVVVGGWCLDGVCFLAFFAGILVALGLRGAWGLVRGE